MKLIIEIPDHEYKYTCERTLSDRTLWDDAIRNGTPLDDVIGKIDKAYDDLDGYDPYALGTFANMVSDILDNIGKAESEE